jgi:hypothetical protein
MGMDLSVSAEGAIYFLVWNSSFYNSLDTGTVHAGRGTCLVSLRIWTSTVPCGAFIVFRLGTRVLAHLRHPSVDESHFLTELSRRFHNSQKGTFRPSRRFLASRRLVIRQVLSRVLRNGKFLSDS